MNEKVETALNETRILVLVVQVIVGFQFQSAFTRAFERFSETGQLAILAGLGLQLAALALLLTPPAYHRIVDRGESTPDLCRLTTGIVGITLVLMAVSLGIQLAVIAGPIIGIKPAVALGTGLAAVALFFWWGLEIVVRQAWPGSESASSGVRSEAQGCEAGMSEEKTSLSDKIKFALTECRVVLPGAQALMGFQFVTTLAEPFGDLPYPLKLLHLGSLFTVGISAILLMAPAAFHRIVERGESTERVFQFTGAMLLAAMVFLSVGIAGDVFVVTEKITKSMAWAWMGGALTLAISCGLWFGYTLVARSHSSAVARQPVRGS